MTDDEEVVRLRELNIELQAKIDLQHQEITSLEQEIEAKAEWAEALLAKSRALAAALDKAIVEATEQQTRYNVLLTKTMTETTTDHD